MDNHARAVTLNAQANARAWYVSSLQLIATGQRTNALLAQRYAAYWNELALSHLSAE